MNNNDDFYVKMLRTYFSDNDISKEKQSELLDKNPFGTHFTLWEKKYHESNRVLGNYLRRNGINVNNLTIEELTAIGEESLSRYLDDGKYHKNEYNNKKIKVCLVRDNLHGVSAYLPNLLKEKPHFVLGICTQDRNAYIEKLQYYKKLLQNMKDVEIIEASDRGYNICVVKR